MAKLITNEEKVGKIYPTRVMGKGSPDRDIDQVVPTREERKVIVDLSSSSSLMEKVKGRATG